MLVFFESVFEEKFYLSRAATKSVFLDGSLFQNGIEASGLMCQGNFHLRRNVDVKGESFFLGATVEGNFDCSSASFEVLDTTQRALNCERMIIQNNVFLNKQFTAKGEVRFLGARINGDFFCSNGSFESLDEDQHALVCDGMTITGGLFLRRNCQILRGSLDLTRASVGSLVYDAYFWKQKDLKTVYMDGFKYGYIHGDISASFYLENMLGKMPRDEFAPQPYKQLAKVLRTMGHKSDADEVMIALHEKKMEISKHESLSYLFQKIYKWTSLYGYRPLRLVYIMLSIWIFFGFIYWYAASVAVFAPSNPLIFQKGYNCTIDQKGTPIGTMLHLLNIQHFSLFGIHLIYYYLH